MEGNAHFTFIAPQATTPTEIVLTATANKTGYAYGQNQTTVTVNPAVLRIDIEPSVQPMESNRITDVIVYATRNATPVANASVTISSNYGIFSTTTGITDANGQCTFVYQAPNTTQQLSILITANASKNGYSSFESQTTAYVVPPPADSSGLLWTLLLVIVVPIVVIVVVFVLVKLKMLSISFGEEE